MPFGQVADLCRQIKVEAPFLYGAFKWCFEHFGMDTLPPESLPDGLLGFFQCLSSPSPVCAYIHPSKRCIRLLDLMMEIDIKKNCEVYQEVQNVLPILFNLLKDLRFVSKLPEAFKGVILHLQEKAMVPFQNPILDVPVDDDPDEIALYDIFNIRP